MIPITVIRQLIRITIKAVALNVASKEGGSGGELVMSLYNLISEQADLRSWLLLPKNIQALRVYPPVGPATVRIVLSGSGDNALGETSLDLDFANNRTVIVNLRAVGYTPSLPDGITITNQWRTLPRVPLAGRPRTEI